MCSQTRNSCAKAFDNRSRTKILQPKKSRGGGQFDPTLKASRVNVVHCNIQHVTASGYFTPLFNSSMVQQFLFTTCSRFHKKIKYKKNEKGGGHRIHNPRGLDYSNPILHPSYAYFTINQMVMM